MRKFNSIKPSLPATHNHLKTPKYSFLNPKIITQLPNNYLKSDNLQTRFFKNFSDYKRVKIVVTQTSIPEAQKPSTPQFISCFPKEIIHNENKFQWALQEEHADHQTPEILLYRGIALYSIFDYKHQNEAWECLNSLKEKTANPLFLKIAETYLNLIEKSPDIISFTEQDRESFNQLLESIENINKAVMYKILIDTMRRHPDRDDERLSLFIMECMLKLNTLCDSSNTFTSNFYSTFTRQDRFQTALVSSNRGEDPELLLYQGVALYDFLEHGFHGEACYALTEIKENTYNPLFLKIAEIFLALSKEYPEVKPFTDKNAELFNKILNTFDRRNKSTMHTILIDTLSRHPDQNNVMLTSFLATKMYHLAKLFRFQDFEHEDKALQLLDEALTLKPDYAAALKLKIGMLAEKGQLPNGETFEFTDFPKFKV